LEALRQLLCRERSDNCFIDKTTGPCVPTPGNGTATPTKIPSDIAEELETEVIQELSSIVTPKGTTFT
jgi:hypothetical protein